MRFHRILVPVDFSSSAWAAYQVAEALVRQFGGELLVLHVVDARLLEPLREVGGQEGRALVSRLQKKVGARFRAFVDRHSRGLKLRQILVTGIPFHEIVKAARFEKTDLIVMGRHGGGAKDEFERIVFGSTAEKVLRIAPCAVLCIPGVKTEKSRKREKDG